MHMPLVLDEFIPYRLSFTSNLVSDTIARAYAALFALTIPEWRLVAVVAETGGVTQQEIGRRTRMDKVMTEAGRSLYGVVAPQALALEARIFAAFTPEELAGLKAMLRRIDAETLALRP